MYNACVYGHDRRKLLHEPPMEQIVLPGQSTHLCTREVSKIGTYVCMLDIFLFHYLWIIIKESGSWLPG